MKGCYMNYKKMNMKEAILNSKDIIYKRGLIGGIVGAGAGFLLSPRVLTLPKMKLVNTVSPIFTTIGGALIGSIAGTLIGSLNSIGKQQNNTQQIKKVNNDADKIELRGEVLDLHKQRVQTGEVNIHKEIIKDEENITIPITRENLVIESKECGKDSSDLNSLAKKAIRIPIKEERFKVVKYPVPLENVLAYKNKIHGLEHIEETLESEKLKVETKGEANVIVKDKGKDKGDSSAR